MIRPLYIFKKEELRILLNGMITRGPEVLYNTMKSRALMSMKKVSYADDIIMDQYEAVLKVARTQSNESWEDKKTKNILYNIASLLRILAHVIYREYLKIDRERDNERFLRLVK